jgi:hypothetical protein
MTRVRPAKSLDGHHEDIRRDHGTKKSSDRAFGFVFTTAFAVVAFFPLTAGNEPRLWSIGLAVAFLLISIVRPRLLSPLNKLWLRLALFQARLMQPLWMGVIFFLAITPMAVILRVFKSDSLELKWDARARTYWKDRSRKPFDPKTLRNQY